MFSIERESGDTYPNLKLYSEAENNKEVFYTHTQVYNHSRK